MNLIPGNFYTYLFVPLSGKSKGAFYVTTKATSSDEFPIGEEKIDPSQLNLPAGETFVLSAYVCEVFAGIHYLKLK